MAIVEVDLSNAGRSSDLRLVELLAVSSLWLLVPSLALGQLSPRTALAAVAAGAVAGIAGNVPLSPGATGMQRTATALRALEATLVGSVAALAILMVGHSGTLPALAIGVLVLATWAIFSISTSLSPMQLSAEMPPPLRAGPPIVAGRLERRLKRSLDIVGSLTLLLITSPILALTAIAIRRHDGGPVLFRQPRMAQKRTAGKGGNTFQIYKFRSMVLDAEAQKDSLRSENERTGPLFKLSHDPRITPVGSIIRELSIDELPQLLNVLKGEMSLVGPRPALVDEAASFDTELATERAHARPGITGLWQAEARSDPDFGRYRALDLFYVRNWSLGLDIRILCATVAEVLSAVSSVPLRKLGLLTSVSADAISHEDIGSGLVIDLRSGVELLDLAEIDLTEQSRAMTETAD